MIRSLPLLAIAALLLLAIPAVSSQPTPTPTPIPVSGRFALAPGSYEVDCLDGQPATFQPPDRVICPTEAAVTPTGTPTPTTPPPSPTPIPAGFIESFDGQPTTPQPWRPADWDVTVHSRDRETWYALDSMTAAHGPGCEPPPGQHTNNSYEGAVFLCRDHVMSALKASGYGVIYLTPNQMVDFSAGEAVIRFDVSTLRTSNRDWIDLWITPYEDNLQTPLEDWLPDLNGEPRRAIHIRMRFGTAGNLSGSFEGHVINAFDDTTVPLKRTIGYEAFFPPSAALRQTFELRISQAHIRFGMPVFDLWWLDTDMAALDWTAGVVQFGHHSYNPLKDCPTTCQPNTWHWDNVSISPAVPFTILRADRRYADPTQPGPLSFPAPAPADSHLRFSGIGNSIEISTDSGATWTAAVLQAQESVRSDHFRTYWSPIPEGTTSVLIRGQNWWGGKWHVRDISIWAR
jgi:hypothetical protein